MTPHSTMHSLHLKMLFGSLPPRHHVCSKPTLNNQHIQETLANANVSARQQCMYEGRYRRNLSSVENPTVEANIMSLSCMQPMHSQITHPCLTPPLGGIPFEFLDETYPAQTRGMGLLYGENRMILASTVFD